MTDVIRGVLLGLAITAAIVAVIFVCRPAQSPAPVYVPTAFSPAPVPSPHCPAATLSPAPLRGRPDCEVAP